ncbi:MAG: DUF542 domain-containing protein [Cyanobacteria bacterium SZAS TMP-1]|nr:DUF542 domain-containing protein [Cyanobacteria bacterium SZAS TMP-1]
MSYARYICTICKYVAEGPGGGDLAVADLAEDFQCPSCGAARSAFEGCQCESYPLFEASKVGPAAADTINAQASLAAIVMQYPPRAQVFENLGIDYCCDGGRTLAAACAEKGLPVLSVALALAAVTNKHETVERDFSRMTLEEIVDDIQSIHHQYLRREFPEVSKLVDKVAAVHGARHPELLELKRLFDVFKDETLAHIDEEDGEVFYLLLEVARAESTITTEGARLEDFLAEHKADHKKIGRYLARVRELTGDYKMPADGCASYKAMLSSLENLEKDIHLHVSKENYLIERLNEEHCSVFAKC